MFGDQNLKECKSFNEKSEFVPMSPYAASKVSAYYIGGYYNRVYGIKFCTAISFNHESPFRNELFVTQKIVKAAAIRSQFISTESLKLGNLEAVRDWGHARDYCDAYFRMMDNLEEKYMVYVVATGQCSSVRDFCGQVYQQAGFFNLKWTGQGINEKLKGQHKSSDKEIILIEVDSEYLRPGEVPFLRGDASKIKNELGW